MASSPRRNGARNVNLKSVRNHQEQPRVRRSESPHRASKPAPTTPKTELKDRVSVSQEADSKASQRHGFSSFLGSLGDNFDNHRRDERASSSDSSQPASFPTGTLDYYDGPRGLRLAQRSGHPSCVPGERSHLLARP